MSESDADLRGAERHDAVQKHYEWLIVGGGIHGVHLAARLIGEAGLDAEDLCILDPGAELLSAWRRATAITGMEYLRSPAVHHLDLRPASLRHFAGRRQRYTGLFRAPYERPALDLFNDHCDRVIELYGLQQRHVRGRAVRCQLDCDAVQVTTSTGNVLSASRVVLAIGSSDQPSWPSWAPRDEPRVGHVLAPTCQWPAAGSKGRQIVVGGGMTAAQVALRLVREGHMVQLVARHPPRVHQFDSDPGWLGPKLMPIFQRERDPGRRRGLIQLARHRGSLTPEVHRALRHAEGQGRLVQHEVQAQGVRLDGDEIRLEVDGGEVLRGEHVLLATGYATHRPGGKMLDRLIANARLPCAQCGYPTVDALLRWHPRIYVAGPLAELELGPVARNIAGARRAGDRIVQAQQAGH